MNDMLDLQKVLVRRGRISYGHSLRPELELTLFLNQVEILLCNTE
jgi:hypothetical protein